MSSIYPISHVCLSLLGCKPPQCVHSSMLYLKHCPTSNRLAVYLSSEQSYLTPSRSLIDGYYSLLFLVLFYFIIRGGKATGQYAFPEFHSRQQQYSHAKLQKQCFSGTFIFTLFSIIFTSSGSLSFAKEFRKSMGS